ncbi:winged helix-turn-helix transcriptional regulator [Streptomyces sp. NPDC058662]|uniref:winged helix-turn-helix transcriptional regulator n=1 Tax=Streptomyces sp. NPDC058662 TaxID=3346583 RepID=UPI00364A7B1E
MTLPRDYPSQACALSRAMEVVGERWTLLIVRDAFLGVRRFKDFAAHLGTPRAVLSDRLASLTAAGVLTRVPAHGPRPHYELTPRGIALWPAVRALSAWGEDHHPAPGGVRRIFRHAADDAPVAGDGRCTACGRPVEAADLLITPGPGLPPPADGDDPVTAALHRPHRLLRPLHLTKGTPA